MSHASVLIVLAAALKREEIEDAVAAQMMPFDEGGEWFADGSRWDWYEIGGRFDGRLGASNVVRHRDLDLEALAVERRARAINCWEAAQKKENRQWRSLKYGVEGDETLGTYLARRALSLTPRLPMHYALLRERHWNEGERLGWFGGMTATECERKGELVPRCLHKDETTGARIVTWQCDSESWDRDVWPKLTAEIDPDKWLVTVDYHV